ncbi:hypothetical protein SAMN05216271_3284 [Halopseudomonas sabulinigri]|uniref:Uncharacterized protein n=2 Tax=Halopseudomonas sabulinigri TaxID=472181 RepID=A0A1H1WQ98_9GAMM|nr:hypothetical protein SAMN05216271_3284 [Halopseudomonas sabulinigri]
MDFYSGLVTDLKKSAVAELFNNKGWTCRKCAWDDYELKNEFSDFVIEGNDEILMNGIINKYDESMSKIIEVLESNYIQYSIEVYGDDGALLRFYENS